MKEADRSKVILVCAIAVFGLSVASAQAASPAAKSADWEWPERMENAQVMSASTSTEQLRTQMLRFTGALGVRCSHCHVGKEGQPLSTFDFPSDAKPQKNIARAMMKLVFRLNTQDLPAIAGLTQRDPNVRRVTCFTCHRGMVVPVTEKPAVIPPPAPAAAPAAAVISERGAS